MSTATEFLPLIPTEGDRPRRRHLQPVEAPARRRRPRVAYALTAIAGILVIGAAQLGLSIAATESTYRVSELTQQQRELTWHQQELGDGIAGLSSPQYLAANAAALGMVINQSPTYLRLSDGKIIGPGKAATANSSVDPLGRTVVGNALVSRTPLVTDPDATMADVPVEGAETPASTLPPPITDGLPTPTTR